MINKDTAGDFSGAPKTLQEKQQILMFSKIMHTWNFLLQITRLKARGRQIYTEPQTSKRQQCYSPANNPNSLPIWDPAAGCRFFQTASQNCPQSTCCCYCDNTVVPAAPTAESNFHQLPPAVGSQPRGGEAGTPGSPGAPGSPSFPSLRGSPLSRPRVGDNGDPQPLRRPKSHPTWQPLTTADSAVATSLVAPARCFTLAGPSRLRHGGFPVPRWAGGGKEREAGWRLRWAAEEGEEERRKRRAGAELCQLPPPLGPRGRPAPLWGAVSGLAPHPRLYLGLPRRTDPTLPRAGPRGIISLSHFVP